MIHALPAHHGGWKAMMDDGLGNEKFVLLVAETQLDMVDGGNIFSFVLLPP